MNKPTHNFGGNYPLQDRTVKPMPNPLSPLPATPEGLQLLLAEADTSGLGVRTIGALRSLAQLQPALRLAVNLKSALGYVLADRGEEQRFGLRPYELETLRELEGAPQVSLDSKRMAYGLFCMDERETVLAAILVAAQAAWSQRDRCLSEDAE